MMVTPEFVRKLRRRIQKSYIPVDSEWFFLIADNLKLYFRP